MCLAICLIVQTICPDNIKRTGTTNGPDTAVCVDLAKSERKSCAHEYNRAGLPIQVD